MDSLTAVVIAGAVCAGFVQGLSGFAFGLTAMSFWAWTLDPQLAAVLVVFGSLTGQVIAAISLRRAVDWRQLTPYLLGGIAGVPLGAWLLPLLDARLFKALLGMLLVVWCPAMLFAHRLPRVRTDSRAADAVVGGIGGAMGGLGGFTGVVPTLWCTLRRLPKDEQRAIVQNFNLAALAVTLGVYIARGVVTREMLPMFAIVAPAMLVPTLLGARLYVGLSEATFRKVVLSLLTLSGLAMVAASLPLLLGR